MKDKFQSLILAAFGIKINRRLFGSIATIWYISMNYMVISSLLIPDIRQGYFLALARHIYMKQIRKNIEIKS